MPLDLVKERIVLNNQAGSETKQLLLESEIIVPDNKPDIDVLLRCSGQDVILTEQTVREGGVDFKGEVILLTLYRAKREGNPVYAIESTIPFEDSIEIEGVTPNTQVNLEVGIDNVGSALMNDRKFKVDIVLTVFAEAQDQLEEEVVKGVENMPEMQVLTGTMNVNHTVENKKDRFLVKEELALASGKPNIGEVLFSDVNITGKEVRPMDGRVLVRGNVNMSTVYRGDEDDNVLEVMEHEIPFNGYIEAKDVTPTMLAQADLKVLEKDIRPMTDEDGEDRVLDTSVTIGADLKVTDSEEIEFIQDAYFPGKPLEIDRQEIFYTTIVGINRNQYTIKEPIVIDENLPAILRVGKVWAFVKVDDITVKEDLVEVQGVVTFEILYIGEDDETPINVVEQSVPFTQEIEIKGAKEGDIAKISARVEDVSFNVLSDREGEARVTVVLDALVMEEKNGDIIVGIEFGEIPEDEARPLASAVIYVVQRGDSLWTIAKKYNTTLDDILAVNDIENPDMIFPGQKLLILKKPVE